MQESQLIFIVSQPRSGSTYLQNILSNNLHVNTTSEPWILLNFANQLKSDLIEGSFDNQAAQNAFNEYLLKYKALNFKQEFKKLLLKLYEPMLEGGFSYVIDKTPRYWEIIDELNNLFPESKIIVLKRNPVSVLKSMIKTWQINDLERLANLKRDILYAPQVLHNFCEKNKDNKNVYALKYEDLLENKQSEIEKIYIWLGIDFDDGYLNTSANDKFKGAFGDPYQNKNVKKKVEAELLGENFENLKRGYVNYLSNDFLYDYGEYPKQESEPTTEFDEFLKMEYAELMLKEKELLRLKNSLAYKIGKTLLAPFGLLNKNKG
ncbi:MAG: sulfotransferase [Candidatus Paceibacterota bacterium]